MRTVLMVPANQPRKVLKAATVQADAVLFDLEDSVPIGEQKEIARQAVLEALGRHWDVPVYVRVNSVEDEQRRDLEALGRFHICLPKSNLSTVNRLTSQGIRVAAALIEDALGVIDAPAIARTPGLEALMVGLGDMSAYFGVPERRDDPLLAHARARVVISAKAAGVGALDGGLANYRDEAAFRRVCESARSMGFDGMLCIHPSHVTVAKQVFTSTDDEVEWANRVVATVQAAKAQGQGVGLMDDEIVDEAHVRHARRILDRA